MIENTLKRSWEITKLTFSVMKEDKELIIYPVLAGFFSLLLILSLAIPTVIISLLENTGAPLFGVMEYFLMFVIYFGLAFIATFFNTCVVYTAKKRFNGENATPIETFKFAVSKIHLIAMWSILTATVGLLLMALENMARRAKGIGGILLHILRGILSVSWSIVTIFVVPAMVYNDLTPIDAIKKSIEVLKKTWGESLVRYLGLGTIQTLVLLAGLIPLLLITVGSFMSGMFILAGIMVLIVIIYLAIVSIIFSLANSIFNTALFEYASTGKIPKQYNKDIMEHAFKHEKKNGLFSS
ncbi:hypothetical protein HN385_00305 [archaeon]|jgi:hypothetical protein|nr:hypothetical protein [archaeon]MBT3451635.1 hypothetical protein [archaeon]MBT6869656.1 hypothetical protein [archaeon]MBT7192424.1 hypothetical protein [archaeon]MBT7380225.1 hypothetical protein [archaeon]